jgi:hypothetical protein
MLGPDQIEQDLYTFSAGELLSINVWCIAVGALSALATSATAAAFILPTVTKTAHF